MSFSFDQEKAKGPAPYDRPQEKDPQVLIGALACYALGLIGLVARSSGYRIEFGSRKKAAKARLQSQCRHQAERIKCAPMSKRRDCWLELSARISYSSVLIGNLPALWRQIAISTGPSPVICFVFFIFAT
jgi:hypothetical protein